MNRSQHLAWCKQRAAEYLSAGDVDGAWLSFLSDMQKHDETRDHAALMLGMMQVMGGHLSTVETMRKWIEGFN